MNTEKNCDNKNYVGKASNVKVVNSSNGSSGKNNAGKSAKASKANGASASNVKDARVQAAEQDNRYQSGMGIGYEQDR